MDPSSVTSNNPSRATTCDSEATAMYRVEADVKKLLPIIERLKDAAAEEEGRWNAAVMAQQQNETQHKLQEGHGKRRKTMTGSSKRY